MLAFIYRSSLILVKSHLKNLLNVSVTKQLFSNFSEICLVIYANPVIRVLPVLG